MAKMLKFDANTLRDLETTYLSPEVTGQRRRLLEEISPLPGDRALDIGCGPGFVAQELGQAVGAEGFVCAVDNSDNAIEMARQRCADQKNVQLRNAEATALPYADEEFDLAVVTQVYEYVADMPTALSELHRVLRPGGRVAIIDTDWHAILWHSADSARMARVLKTWDEHLAHPTLPRTLRVRLHDAGLTLRKCIVIPYLDMEYRRDSYSYNMSRTIHRFVRGRQGSDPQEVDAWLDEFSELADSSAYFFCLNRYLFLAEKR